MNVHLVAICGTGMGSLAGLLKEAGHEVRGSDKVFYPPMSDSLRAWGIPTMEGFDPSHLDPDLDLVVVGNACRRDNPEAVAAQEMGLRVTSFPQALYEMFIASRTSVVVAGTHGKTTTSSLLSFLLVQAGRDPSFLVGGIPLDFGRSYRLGTGPHFVVEGDEYDAAYFDKRPKFLHYAPHVAILTSVEYDHADIYPDMDAYRRAFEQFAALLPLDGLMVAAAGDPEVDRIVSGCACRVIRYGMGSGAGWRALDLDDGPGGTSFTLVVDGAERVRIQGPLSGRHNVANTLAVLAVADALGVAPDRAGELVGGYRGVARRMQVCGEAGGVTVVDDFAHHPTAVAETLLAARKRWPDAHLVAVFEPRTNTSRRSIFQKRYEEVFGQADQVALVPPFDPGHIPEDERFDSARLVAALTARGKSVALYQDAGAVVEGLVPHLPAGAVVLVMSNGAFDGIHDKLLDALAQQGART